MQGRIHFLHFPKNNFAALQILSTSRIHFSGQEKAIFSVVAFWLGPQYSCSRLKGYCHVTVQGVSFRSSCQDLWSRAQCLPSDKLTLSRYVFKTVLLTDFIPFSLLFSCSDSGYLMNSVTFGATSTLLFLVNSPLKILGLFI